MWVYCIFITGMRVLYLKNADKDSEEKWTNPYMQQGHYQMMAELHSKLMKCYNYRWLMNFNTAHCWTHSSNKVCLFHIRHAHILSVTNNANKLRLINSSHH